MAIIHQLRFSPKIIRNLEIIIKNVMAEREKTLEDTKIDKAGTVNSFLNNYFYVNCLFLSNTICIL